MDKAGIPIEQHQQSWSRIEQILTKSLTIPDKELVHQAYIEYTKLRMSEIQLKIKCPQQHTDLLKLLSGKIELKSQKPYDSLFKVFEMVKSKLHTDVKLLGATEYEVLKKMDITLTQHDTESRNEDGEVIRTFLDELSKTKGKSCLKAAEKELNALSETTKKLKKQFPQEYEMYKKSIEEMEGRHTIKPHNGDLYKILMQPCGTTDASNAMNEYLFLKKMEENYRILKKPAQPPKSNGSLDSIQKTKQQKVYVKSNESNIDTTKPIMSKQKRPSPTRYTDNVEEKEKLEEGKDSKTYQKQPGNTKIELTADKAKKEPYFQTQQTTNENMALESETVTKKTFEVKNVSTDKVVIYTLEENDENLAAVKIKDAKIAELTGRLSSLAGNKLIDGNPDISDLSDKNRPTKLGEMFGLLNDDEWTDAYEELNSSSRTEDDILRTLSKIVETAYEFCNSKATDQLAQLEKSVGQVMIRIIIEPNQKTVKLSKEQQEYLDSGKRYIKDYRKATASAAVTELVRNFREKEMPKILKRKIKDTPVKTIKYADKCVKLLWLMCVQNPPMVLKWASEKDTVDTSLFKCYNKEGKNVVMNVWPAVYICQGGPLISKGSVKTY